MNRVPDKPVWAPPAAAPDITPMGRFLDEVACRHGLSRDYASLHRWSISEPQAFWRAVADFTGLHFSSEPVAVFEPGEPWYSGRWFPGARFNYAERLLAGATEDVVLIARDERGRREVLTRGALRARVLGLAGALQTAGVGRGDRVAAVLPNGADAVAIFLASAAIGAVFSSCSPDFGADAIVERFSQISPKVLFICDGYDYGGRRFDCSARLAAVAAQLPGIAQTVLVPFAAADADGAIPAGVTPLRDWLVAEPIKEFVPLPFGHPLCILYSSGTTGRPKCIVHGAGGTLIQHLKEHVLHTGLCPGERLFYFTTCGWMMWNWLVSALASGATIVLYDGSPLHPGPDALWQMADEERVTVFGTSPRFLAASERAGAPGPGLRLPHLRLVLSTGAPLSPAAFDYVAERFTRRVQLCSISGGTDLISCFVLGNPLQPVWRGEIQGPGLGMAVEVFDERGQPLDDGQGELVCTRPFPSMPLGFWNDPGGRRYRAAYFERFPGAWRQGDIAERTEHGGFLLHGRADAVLNPGGVRIGSAEVCAPALTVAGVEDALAVAWRRDDDERVVLFVVLESGRKADDRLRDAIRSAIRNSASPRHVPDVIVAAPDLPRTLSGKNSELAVRAMIHGQVVTNTDALANPGALEFFRDVPELR